MIWVCMGDLAEGQVEPKEVEYHNFLLHFSRLVADARQATETTLDTQPWGPVLPSASVDYLTLQARQAT